MVYGFSGAIVNFVAWISHFFPSAIYMACVTISIADVGAAVHNYPSQ